MSETGLPAVRLDKWLWAARFFKTRSQAATAVSGGKVHCNGERSKPGRLIKPGDCLRIRKGSEETTVLVQQLAERRVSAKLAQALYTETEQSKAARLLRQQQRKAQLLSMPVPRQRPNKRERRQLIEAKLNR